MEKQVHLPSKYDVIPHIRDSTPGDQVCQAEYLPSYFFFLFFQAERIYTSATAAR